MADRRVVVTGLGWVTSLGLDVENVWGQLLSGESGIGPIERFDTEQYATRFGGQIKNFEAPHIDPREAKRLDRFAQYALNASADAVQDAGIDFDEEDRWRCGAVIGSGIGGIEEFETGYQRLIDKGPGRVSPFMVPKLMCNAGSGNVSIYYGLRGPNSAVATACASAAHAIGSAYDAIQRGDADVMIGGGSEAAVTPLGLACFIALKALSQRNDDPQHASRPFDRDRDGFILSEGAGIVLLEEYEHARRRGASIYAELLGYGESADGSHITAPDPDGGAAARAMESALAHAGVGPEEVDYINAHGTSTPQGDLAEVRAIKRLLEPGGRYCPVSSTKSMTGHLLGASGGVEAAITAKAIQEGKLPPTANLDHPDAECDLDFVPDQGREQRVRYALSNSFGFGGHNLSLVLGAV
jgi:3-oxoacyl-[acyl-carrier-protein] synthase II